MTKTSFSSVVRTLLVASVVAATACSTPTPAMDVPAVNGDGTGIDTPSTPIDTPTPDAQAMGDGGQRPGTTANAMCLTNCMADPDLNMKQVCGTDRQTYSLCQWNCATVPMNVSVFPGACQPDGSPPADGPPRPADGVHTCDWLKIGTNWIAVECGSDLNGPIQELGDTPGDMNPPDRDSGVIADTGIVLADSGQRGMPSPEPMGMPASVNHRARFGPAENQGSVGSCTAFATTAGLESAVAARGLRVDLSEQHLWLRYCQPSQQASLEAARRGIASKATATMLMYAYDGDMAMGRAAMCQTRGTPDTAAVMALDGTAQFSVTSVDEIEPENGAERATPAQIQRQIANGNDVVVAVALSSAEWSTPPNNTIPETNVVGASGHAVLLVGYEMRNGQLFFLMRNSWGEAWADRGYAWVSAAYLQTQLYRPAFTIQAACESCLRSIPNCAAGQAASAVDGTCRMVCPGGALADAMGVCPPPPMCDPGFVNDASGVCVAACQMGPIQFAGGITGDCSPSGCRYSIPMGVDGCMTAGGCTLHCGAPACSLGTSQNEFGNAIAACMRPRS